MKKNLIWIFVLLLTIMSFSAYGYNVSANDGDFPTNISANVVIGLDGVNRTYSMNESGFTIDERFDKYSFDVFGGNDGTGFGKTFNDGTPSGGVTISDGAMNFDGVDGYIERTALTYPSSSTDWTYSMWINPQDLNSPVLFSNRINTNSRVTLYASLNNLRANVYDGTTNKASSGVIPSLNTWSFITVTYNGSIKLYINNVVQVGTVGSTTSNSDGFFLGSLGASNFFNGLIDNVQIYDRALTQEEISQIYNAGKDSYSPVGDGLVGQWSGRDFEGSKASPTKIIDTNHIVKGVNEIIPEAITFDGVDDYISIPDSDSLDLKKNTTLSFWMKKYSTTQSFIFEKGSAPSPRWDLYTLGSDLIFRISDGTNTYTTDWDTTYVLDTWTFVTLSLSDTSVSFYKDGVFINSRSISDLGEYNNVNDLLIGKRIAGNFYDGSIANVVIFNRALTEDEITQLYTNSSLSTAGIDSMVAHYPLQAPIYRKLVQNNNTADIYIYKTNYYPYEETNADFGVGILGSLYQSEVSFSTDSIVTGTNLANANVTINGITKDISEKWYLSGSDTFTATFSKAGWFNKSVNFTITPMTSTSVVFEDVYSSELTIRAKDTYLSFNFYFSYWNFDEITGTTLIDSFNRYNGTNINAVIGENGIVGTSYNFSGSNKYVNLNKVAQDLLPSKTSVRTFSFWTYLTSEIGNNPVISYGENDQATKPNFFSVNLLNKDTTEIYASSFQDGNTFVNKRVTFSHNKEILNKWTYHTILFIGDSSIKYYINGNLTNTGSISNWADISSGLDVTIGKARQAGGDGYFNGLIDEFGILNVTLSDSEIQSIYNSQKEGRSDSSFSYLENHQINVSLGSYFSTQTGANLTFLLEDGLTYNIDGSKTGYYSNETSYLVSGMTDDFDVNLEPLPLEDFTLLTPSNTKTPENTFNITWTESVSPSGKNVLYNVSIFNYTGSIQESFSTSSLFYNLNLTNYLAGDYIVRVTAIEQFTNSQVQKNTTLYVDKLNYVYFYDGGNSSALVNKSVQVIYPSATTLTLTTDLDGKVNFSSYDGFSLQNGTYQITFLGSAGYVSPITFNITKNITELPFNQSYNISLANLQIFLRDGISGDLITQNITVSVDGLGTFYIANGSFLFQDIALVSNTYSVYASSVNYTYAQRTFQYTNQENLEITLFLYDRNTANVGSIIVRVFDSFLDIVSGADVRLQEYSFEDSSFFEVGQSISNSNGQSTFQALLIDKSYRILVTNTIDGVTYQEYSSEKGNIFYFDGEVVNVYLNTIIDYSQDYLDGLPVTVTNTTLTNNISYHQVSFFNSLGLDHTVCLSYTLLSKLTRTQLQEVCVTGSSGTVNYDGGYNLTSALSEGNVLVEVYILVGTSKVNYYRQVYTNKQSFEEIFGDLIAFIILLAFIGGLALSVHLKRIDYFVYLEIFLSFIWAFVTPSWMSFGLVSVNVVMGFMVLFLAQKSTGSEEN